MDLSWNLKKFKVKDLQEYSKNPRTLSKDQYFQLKNSIQKFGLIDKPIVTEEGLLVGGHQRKRILKELGIKEVECWVPSRELTEKEFEELNIRHNKNTGEWDFDILGNQWEAHDLVRWGFSMDELGIDLSEVLSQSEEDHEQDEKQCCETCGQKLKAKSKRKS